MRSRSNWIEFWSVGFWGGEGKTGEPGEKPLGARERTNNKGWWAPDNKPGAQPTYAVDAGIWTRATLLGGECSHHCATLAPRQTLSWLRWKLKWAIKGHSIVPIFRPKRKTIPFGAAHTYMVHHIGEYIPLRTLAGCPYRHLLTGLGWNVSCIRTSE